MLFGRSLWFWMGVAIIGLLVAWFIRVRRIRSKFRHVKTGKMIPGSDLPPICDYIRYGFENRNFQMPYGDFELSFPLYWPALIVSEPRVIKELLGSVHQNDFDKGELTLKGVEPIAGRENLFSADGANWVRARAICNPAFRPAFIRQATDVALRVAQSMADQWAKSPQGPKNVSEEINQLTLKVICAAAFGTTTEADTVKVMESYKGMISAAMLQMTGFGACGANAKMARHAKTIDTVAREIIGLSRKKQASEEAIRKQQGEEAGVDVDAQGSLVEVLLKATSEDGSGQKLTEQEIIDNVKIFLFAGHETAASTIIWIVYFLGLARYKHYHDEIVAELHEVLGNGEDQRPCGYDDLRALNKLSNFVKEILRLYPPAWTINRGPKRDLVVDGYTIPAGTSIMINTLRLHRREDIFVRAYEFMPERWDNKDTLPGAYGYLPFGGGPRMCIGMQFAKMEIMVSVAIILQRFKVSLVNPEQNPRINFFGGSTIRPKGQADIRLTPLPTRTSQSSS